MAAQAVEAELDGTQAHPVATAIDARAARLDPVPRGDREMDAAAKIDAVGAVIDLDQYRERVMGQAGRHMQGYSFYHTVLAETGDA